MLSFSGAAFQALGCVYKSTGLCRDAVFVLERSTARDVFLFFGQNCAKTFTRTQNASAKLRKRCLMNFRRNSKQYSKAILIFCRFCFLDTVHSRPQRPRSFWSAPKVETSVRSRSFKHAQSTRFAFSANQFCQI